MPRQIKTAALAGQPEEGEAKIAAQSRPHCLTPSIVLS
jgi:hypothetical protein